MVLITNNLSKTYRNGRGIKGISFQVDEGDIYGLLGPNGSGKTTTLKIIANLSHADEGDVQIFGRSVKNDRERSLEQVGCLIETPALFDYLSAKRNLENAASYYREIKAPHIEDMLRQTGLLQYQNDKVKDFSLGMKQRLGLALALLSNPKLVILDEPANGLDIEGMVTIREIIMKQANLKRTTFLITSHLAHELELMCNKIAIMKEGCLLKTATMKEAIEQSGTLENYFLETIGCGEENSQ